MTHWLWWLIGTVGLGGALLTLAVFVVGWPAIIGTKAGRVLLAIGVAILVALGMYAKGKAEGRAAERARLAALTAKEVANAAAERKRIDALTDEQVDAELSKWDRKP